MQYHQFLITIPGSHTSALAETLFKLGSLGMSEQGDSMTAYFPEALDPQVVIRELEFIALLLQHLTPPIPMTFRYSPLPSQDWNSSWKKAFKPLSVGARFTVLPPWEQQIGHRIPLIIDPGMAFGTGHHETTRSCLELMERYSLSMKRERFLDIGTGTGLLAIAACALGFPRVIAIDTDPLAIEAARENIRLNRSKGVELVEGDIDAAGGTFDMIAANLISRTLITLAGTIAKLLEPAGVVIMSGILKGQENEVATAAAKADLHAVEHMIDGKWVTLALRHQDSR